MKWEEVKLGDTATFINGYPFKPTDWSTTGKEIIRIQNLTKSNGIEANRYEGIIQERYLVKKGDLLISWSGTLGVYEWGGDDAWLNQHIFKVVFDKAEVNKNYFKFLIQSKLHELEQQVHGATMKHITKGKFDNIKVPLPPLHIQEQIADTLDKANILRRRDQELLTKYDELAQAIFYDMFGDIVKNERDIKKIRLGELTQINSGSTPSRDKNEYYGGTIPWVKTTEVKGKRIFETEECLTEEGLKNSSCNIYEKGSIVLAMYGQGKTRGNVGLLEIAAATNQACAVIKPNESFITEFLFYQLKYSYDDLRSLGRGGTQPNLNVGIVKDFEVVIPHINEQIEFCKKQKVLANLSDQTLLNIKKSDVLFNTLLISNCKWSA